jgi:hypothetical protein
MDTSGGGGGSGGGDGLEDRLAAIEARLAELETVEGE